MDRIVSNINGHSVNQISTAAVN